MVLERGGVLWTSSSPPVNLWRSVSNNEYHCIKYLSTCLNLTKAFDTVNRSALWIIPGKLAWPPQLVEMLKQLHHNMKVRVTVDGSLSK